MSKPIQVEIDHSAFWTIFGGQPIHMNVSVFKTLRDAGIPVDGGIELRGVTHGTLKMWNENRNGKRFCIYEWEAGKDSLHSNWEEEEEL
jgi:hypothetical protein